MLSPALQLVAQNCVNIRFTQAIQTSILTQTGIVFKQPSLLYNQGGKIAASAHLQKNLIKLHPVLFTQNTEYFLDQVIPHELAHILVHQCYRKRVKPHGCEWQAMMQEVFKLPAIVTHDLDVSDLISKGFKYYCDCSVIELSKIRHNKVQRGTQQYKCRKCNALLRQQKNRH